MFCECGCGKKTRLAPETDASKGWKKGVPLRFIHRHQGKRDLKYSYTTSSPEYAAWWSMVDRCSNSASKSYRRYGGRGIKVQGRLRTYEGFLGLLGRRPSRLYSLDRIDNDGNYVEGNVRWATKSQQSSNQKKPKLTRQIAEKIRKLYSAGTTPAVLSPQFGISKRHIHHIVAGQYWRPLT